MTVIVMIGRRVPKNWIRRQAQTVRGLMSFQENMWVIIKQSLNMAKKKAKYSKVLFVITNENENEDINYCIEWIKVVIQGTPEEEQEEYEEANKIYEQFGKIIKKDFDINNKDNMKGHFKTKMLNLTELSEAYNKGYGAIHDNSISQKFLELGILTHIKKIEDYNSREIIIKPDIGTF